MRFAALIAALAIVASAFAELRQDTFTVIGNTNGAATVVSTPLEGNGTTGPRGNLRRIIVTVGGSGTRSNDLWITDTEGFSLTTNSYVGGTTTTIWSTNATPLPFIGLIINTSKAQTGLVAFAAITNTVKVMYERTQ